MAYIDATFLDEAFGAANVTALCPTAAERDRVIALADGEVYTALYNAGYQTAAAPGDVTPATTDADVQRLSFGIWLNIAHLRNRKELPPEARVYTDLLASVRDGSYELPGLTKTTSRAVGGVSTTNVSPTSANGRPPIFDRKHMTGYG